MDAVQRSRSGNLLHRLTLAVFALAAISFLLVRYSVAQQPASTPANLSTTQPVIKTNVRQVLIDVVVTDRRAHSVKGLQQDDFSLFENGERQKIISLEAHSPSPDPSYLEALATPPLPPNTFLNKPLGNENLPLNILLYDVLNTPLKDQPYAHAEIIRFLHKRPIGSRFAIFVLSDKLCLLQGFTDDERLLLAAMRNNAAGLQSSAANEWVRKFPGVVDVSPGENPFASDAPMKNTLDRMAIAESMEKEFYLNQRIELTLHALTTIAKFLNGIPGRKNLIWLSGSFPIQIFSIKNPLNPFGSSVNYSGALRQTANLLTVGQVAVYPVDACGLTTNLDGTGSRSDDEEVEDIHADHVVMQEIAEDTGGHAFYNTDGLADAIATSTDDSSNYYTLAYSPTDTNFDGRLRQIRIKVSGSNFRLAYRQSYIADKDTVIAQRTESPAKRFQNAAIRGAPLSHELIFDARVQSEGVPTKMTDEAIRNLAQFPSFASRKTWDDLRMQKYRIDYTIVGGRITFEPLADGKHHGSFEFQHVAYDLDSNAVSGQWTRVDKAFSLQAYENISKGDYHFKQEISLPTNASWLRLVVKDVLGDHIGSLEVPLPHPSAAEAKIQ